MPIAIWLPKYETGNASVDRQHKHLFEMVNDLHHGIISGHGRETMGPTLKSLADWLTHHIKEEDMEMISWMREKSG